MIILAIDSSGGACSCALWQDRQIIAQSLLQNGLTHSVNLMPMLENMLSSCGVELYQVDYIACVTGPGSFTGVRIGVSAARAMSAAAEKPCIAINSLEALAQRSFNGTICPMLDARRSQVYCAAFNGGEGRERLLNDEALSVDDFILAVKKLPPPYFFTGSGAVVHSELIKQAFKADDSAIIAAENESYVCAAAAAVLAAKNTQGAISRHELFPYYLRASQAEREYEQRHGKRHGK
ncbi:MAG: tRNA (adenosine(37)-N6)-threonylcarbamoyltransferase complex dimerization subunit type 1 TsaB [Christensenellales bacterium]|jgi:tRNA threonylcarbamoyladenosine biosynthesis protein TsaB